ncbi:MAG: lipid A deacylase LpxR family protein [Chitinophagaceae bacterium]|nr:lipid A deacylase LpxR family protein [Chitinophagaceae bacterium]
MGYTPNRDAFGETDPVRDQRPYSSLIGIGRKRIAIFDNPFKKNKIPKGLIIISDLFLGKIGTQGPGKVQNFLHEYLTNSAEVKGWHNQIGNGGRFIYTYNLSASYELWQKDSSSQYVIVTPHITLGNLFLNQGLKIAFSNLTVRKQPFTLTMNSNQVAKRGDNKIQKARSYDSVSLKKEKKFHFEVYGKFYHVNHNTLLMGLPFRDNSIYKIPRSRINQFVFDVGGKAYFSYFPDKTKGKTMNRKTLVYLEILYRSKEFDIAPTHFYGGIGVQFIKLD